MRLATLELLSFGPFENERLVFDDGPSLELVVGPNEAGKTTALRAISALFYGIPERTRDDHRFRMPELRIGATITNKLGERLSFVRRKGRAATLTEPDAGAVIEDARLERMLGGISKDMFHSLFGLDYASLSAGAEALLAGRGEVGQSLFDAGGGRGAHDVLAKLRIECDELFKPAGKNQKINEAIGRLKVAKAKVASASMSGEVYERHVGQLETMQSEQAARARERQRLETYASSINRLLQVLPTLQKLATNERQQAELAETQHLPEAQLLPENARAERMGVEAEGQRAETAVRHLRADLAELEARSAELVAEAAAAGDLRAEDVHELDDLRSVVVAARKDLPRRRSDLAYLEADAKKILVEVGHRAGNGLEVARLDPVMEARIERLMAVRATLDGRLGPCRDEANTATTRLQLAEQRIAALPPAVNVDALGLATLHLRRQHTAQRTREAQFDESRERSRQASERARVGLEGLELAGEVPSEELLLRARAERDRRYAHALGERTDEAMKALAEAIDETDEVSDRLRRESERVSLRARFVAELAGSERERIVCEEAMGQLAEREKVLARELEAAMESVFAAARSAALGVPVADAFGSEGGRAESPGARTLSELLDRADVELTRHKANADERRELMRAKDARVAELAEAMQNRRAAEQDDEDARAALAHALGPLGLGSDSSLEEARELLRETRRCGEIGRKVRELHQRIAAMEAEEVRLVELVARLSSPGAIAMDDGLAAGDALLGRHRRAQEATAQLVRATSMKVAKARALRDADDILLRSQAKLTRLIAQAGAEDIAGRERAEDASQEKRKLLLDRAALEAELAQQGGGRSRAELTTVAAGVDIDAKRAELAEVESGLRHLGGEIDRNSGEIRDLTRVVAEGLAGQDEAQVAADLAQSCLAEIRGHAEKYVTCRLAAELLTQEIERYRSQNQGPVLSMANALFPRLTLGSFSGLRVDYTGAEAALVCVRPNGKDLAVDALSQGARDQLYLALRLASMTHFAHRREPMPFVLDDVLVHFDDARARAAFEVLFDAAQHLQLIFFTHHEHLVELARSVAASHRLHVHHLGKTAKP
ncbi:MAG: hypothetical protein EXR75_05195 [Myxococcales bacterium]|nr:hypothetical protein [Myxococcales bacterium]